MLAEVRRALAAQIEVGMGPLAPRVLAYPPKKIDIPTSGLHVYVQPDPDEYVAAWQTFGTGGRGQVNFVVVCTIPDDSPERAWDRLDDLIDPLSTAPNVFGAILLDQRLGLPSMVECATPLLGGVRSAQRVSEADGAVTFYELTLPVAVIVKRS
jgi:hypothetical protein